MFKWLLNFGQHKPGTVSVAKALSDLDRIRKAMEAKDPQFAASVGTLTIPEARRAWREKYPDDLVSDLVSEARIN